MEKKTCVNNGIDVIDRYTQLFEGKRIGLVTGPTGLNKKMESTIELFKERFDLKALYSPEHGVRGNVQAGVHVDTYTDEKTGVPVYSLYGKNRKPSREMLEAIDVLVMDMQDIGSRYYTYLYTMSYCLQACAEHNKPFIYLDRVNPLGGIEVEGGILNTEFSSFVGMHPITPRYGLTAGELAMLFNTEYRIGCDLHVVKIEGWKREMFLQDTDLLWVNPSPNMTSMDAAVLYNGTCLFEGTNLSEGRGTTKPFEMVGAPWIDGFVLAKRMNEMKLSGVLFRPVSFEPAFSKHQGQLCGGVQIHITDHRAVRSVALGLRLLYEIMDMDERAQWLPPSGEAGRYFIDLLAGCTDVRLRTYDTEALLEKWKAESEIFRSLKEQYHLYD